MMEDERKGPRRESQSGSTSKPARGRATAAGTDGDGDEDLRLDVRTWQKSLQAPRASHGRGKMAGVWVPARRLVVVTTRRGNHMHLVGSTVAQQDVLHPIDALYLLDSGVLDVMAPPPTATTTAARDAGPCAWPFEQAYTALFALCDPLQYRVYSTLRDAGYVPRRPAGYEAAAKRGSLSPDRPTLDWAVYAPKGFRRSDPGPPLFHVVVVPVTACVFGADTIARLFKQSAGVQLRVAAVDDVSVLFYDWSPSDLPHVSAAT